MKAALVFLELWTPSRSSHIGTEQESKGGSLLLSGDFLQTALEQEGEEGYSETLSTA